MKIKNVKVYGLEESIIRSGYPHQIGEPKDIKPIKESTEYQVNQDRIRAYKLANTPIGSGHNNFLKGIIVQFDMSYPQYFTPQLQRYHWIDIISSQSKMHSLTKIKDIKDSCNKYVYPEIIDIINNSIKFYNDWIEDKDLGHRLLFENYPSIDIESKEELFQYIISNLPMGFELWMGISTNYLQLKTIYNQRRHHKLKDDWGYFCNWIETLPMSKLITVNNGE